MEAAGKPFQAEPVGPCDAERAGVQTSPTLSFGDRAPVAAGVQARLPRKGLTQVLFSGDQGSGPSL